MEPDSKRHWATGVTAAILVSLGGLVIHEGYRFLKVLVKAAETLREPPSSLPVALGIILSVAGGLLIPKQTRNAGWVLTGTSLGLLSFAALLIAWTYPRLVTHTGVEFSTGWIWVAVIGTWAITCALAVTGDVLMTEGREKDRTAIKEAKSAFESMTARRDSIAATLKQTTEGKDKVSAELTEEKRLHAQTKARRPYESQLVSLFSLSMGAAWERQCPNQPFLLNHHQGNLDREYGDFIGQAAGQCWLVELKRDWSCAASEFEKPVRVRQFEALGARPDLRITADQCHWLGWGLTDGKEAIIRLNAYWSNWPKAENMPSGIVHEEFANRAFAGDAGHSVGVSPDTFATYLRFLDGLAGGASCEMEDTIAALVFHRDGRRRLRCWIEPDLLSVGKIIAARYELIMEQQREAARVAQELANRTAPRPGRSGPSFGRG